MTLSELFNLLEIEVARQDTWQSKRVGAVMSRLGWEDERKRSGGKWVRQWTKKNLKVGFFPGSPGSTGSAFNDVTHSTDCNYTPTISIDTPINPDSEVAQDTVIIDTSITWISPTDLTGENLQPINPQPDPVDPGEKQTFQKKDVVGCPHKCSYYSLYDTKPFVFKVESDFGTVQVSAEPYHKFKGPDSKIWLTFQTPDGQTLNKSIKAIPDKKVLPSLSKECGVIQQWEEKTRKYFGSKVENPDCKFKVRIVGEDDYEWIEDCVLKDIPNYPMRTNFIFRTPKNTMLTSALGEFEEM